MDRWLASAGLLVLAGFVLFAPRLTRSLAGFTPLRAPGAEGIDRPAAFDERAAPRFLADRDRVELVVGEDTTVGALLRRYPVPAEHLRRQIGAQIGVPMPADEQPLAAGQRLVLNLTPPAS